MFSSPYNPIGINDAFPFSNLKIPLLDITTADCLDAVRNLQLRDTDTFVVSYMKSGTTWVQNIVATLIAAEQGLDLDRAFQHISEATPFLDIDAHWDFSNNEYRNGVPDSKLVKNWKPFARRMWNTHFHFDMMPLTSSQQGKFIYVTRAGLDVACSQYYHLDNQIGEAGSYEKEFPTFFQEWMEGNILYGKWTSHLRSWLPQVRTDTTRFMSISYESLKADLKGGVRKIADHLELNLSDQQIASLVPRFTLTYMQANSEKFQPISVEWKSGFSFLRSGKIGEGKTHLTQEMREQYCIWLHREFPYGLPKGVLTGLE